MGWSIGYDEDHDRFIGYGVPAYCDHPDCHSEIDRGLSYVCGGDVRGGEHGCGLFFCQKHRHMTDDDDPRGAILLCERCHAEQDKFAPSAEHPEWVDWMLEHDSWQEWRGEHPDKVRELAMLARARK